MVTPLISVVMPVWNGERHLRAAVESILKQTFRDFEFLILDDGSNDATPAILAEYVEMDDRVRVIRLDHQGIVVALNRGVAEARASWVARMDCDDVARPERLARQWKAVAADSNAVLCHTQIHIVGEERYVTPAARFVNSEGLIRLRLCYQCPISHPTVMFRKDAFLASGGYLPEERHAEDFGLWGRLLGKGSVVGVPEALLDFRVHGASISKQQAEIQIPLSRSIALRHCRQFLNVDGDDAERAYETLRNKSGIRFRDWLWLVTKCFPKVRGAGLEFWAWVAKQTFQRLLTSAKPVG